jgi:hypothetical protein
LHHDERPLLIFGFGLKRLRGSQSPQRVQRLCVCGGIIGHSIREQLKLSDCERGVSAPVSPSSPHPPRSSGSGDLAVVEDGRDRERDHEAQREGANEVVVERQGVAALDCSMSARDEPANSSRARVLACNPD